MFVYSGNRSPEAKERREQKKVTRDMIRWTVKDWSFRDMLNGEIVFESSRLPEVRRRLTVLCDYVPQWAIDHEFGEVLNNKVFFRV